VNISAVLLLAALCVALNVGAETPASALWNELKTKRDKLPSLHQEFDVLQTSKMPHGDRSFERQIVLDMSQGQWREKSLSGSGTRVRIFDGKDLFLMEDQGDEYILTKHQSKDDDPLPSPYGLGDPDWSKAMEVKRRPCGVPGNDHTCVILEATLKPWMRSLPGGHFTKLLEGTTRVALDTETGLLISSHTAQLIDSGKSTYESDTACTLKRMSAGAPVEASLFKLPPGMHEVKELSKWNAAKIKKQLVGKPAPELTLTDLKKNPVTLSGFKGKTVLLDFWTTWCPPCRADGPALDKLYQKYGDKDLMIVGISVSEERGIVEKFLSEHPRSYPTVLTSENDMPAAYQIAVFPTYIVIDRDGTIAAAVEGDKGFGDLRKLLKKAGLQSE
jgi:cytochrome c biogenesis protein CcmG/thiol:disulfide interchange protein DsbE